MSGYIGITNTFTKTTSMVYIYENFSMDDTFDRLPDILVDSALRASVFISDPFAKLADRPRSIMAVPTGNAWIVEPTNKSTFPMIPGARLYVALNAMSNQEADRYFEKPFYNKMTEEQQQSFTLIKSAAEALRKQRGVGPAPDLGAPFVDMCAM